MARKAVLDPVPRKILETLIDRFDHVVYLLQKETGIQFSPGLLYQMLETYRSARGYLYYGATLQNVPWIFAYMSNSKPIVGQYIRGDSDLIAAIREHDSAAWVDEAGQIVSRSTEVPFLDVCYIAHRKCMDGDSGALQESMLMVVSTDPKHWVYQKVIPFDYQAFQRLVQTPDEKAHRRMDLVEMAREVLGGLLS